MDSSNSQWYIPPRLPAHLTGCGGFGSPWASLKTVYRQHHGFSHCCHLATTILCCPATPYAVSAAAAAAIIFFHSPADATCSYCATLPHCMAQLPYCCHHFPGPTLPMDRHHYRSSCHSRPCHATCCHHYHMLCSSAAAAAT